MKGRAYALGFLRFSRWEPLRLLKSKEVPATKPPRGFDINGKWFELGNPGPSPVAKEKPYLTITSYSRFHLGFWAAWSLR